MEENDRLGTNKKYSIYWVSDYMARIYWKVKKYVRYILLKKELAYWKKKNHQISKLAKRSGSIFGIEYLYMPNNKEIVIGNNEKLNQVNKERKMEYTISSKEKFIQSEKYDLSIVNINGIASLKKEYRGNVFPFLTELKVLYELNRNYCNVPSIIKIDFENPSLIISYIPGVPLREITSVLEKSFIDKIYHEMKKIHYAGVFINDLSYKNIIKSPAGEPFFIDFDRSATKDELGIFFKHFVERDELRFKKLFEANNKKSVAK